jgi:hypothetical protein
MRASATLDGATLKAYAGFTGVPLAMNVTDAVRPGLLGFAIKRRVQSGYAGFLPGLLGFPIRRALERERFAGTTVHTPA